MKKLLLVITLVASLSIVYSQQNLSVRKYQLNLGLGLSDYGIPVYVGVDYGLKEDITLGGELSYRSYSENIAGHNYSDAITSITANGNYHFNTLLDIPENFDFYGGLNLGFLIWNTPSGYAGSHSSGLGLGAQIGGRYYMTDKFGINLELGGGNTLSGGKIGVTFRF